MSDPVHRPYPALRLRYHGAALAALAVAMVLFAGGPEAAAAQTSDEFEFDWRAQLNCPAERQVREGVQYCTGTDQNEHVVHVVVVDLQSSDVRFEYVLPEGYSDGHGGLQECRDPNVPAWAGPEGGCYVYGDRGAYPRMTLAQAVARAEEVHQTHEVAAVIDADYGAPDATHGPEGLLVVRGVRLDGAANCDDDFNAALRPWLGLGKEVDSSTGLLSVEIDRLVSDASPIPAWMYTGIGGGPMLVQDGVVNAGAGTCAGDYSLTQLEAITNCSGYQKTVDPPATESYGGGSCREAPHTAAGISRNKRWLFLAMSTGNDHPDILAEFMKTQLDVTDALKFDGGGSSQMWVAGSTALTIDAGGEGRSLTNYLAVYADDGTGVSLPHAASQVDRVTYITIGEGQTTNLDPTFKNDGSFTWKAEDGVALGARTSLVTAFASDDFYDLPRDVRPGEMVSWDLPVSPTGVRVYRFQMAQDGVYFGDETQFAVVVIPEALKDKREEIERQIEQLIDEMEAEGEEKLEEFAVRIQKLLLEEAERLARGIFGQCFGSLALAAALPALVVVRRSRHNYRFPDPDEGT